MAWKEPTRFPLGVTGIRNATPLGDLPFLNPIDYLYDFDDFTSYVAAMWTVTLSGAGTTAMTDGLGGQILLTNAGADNNFVSQQKLGSAWRLSVGKRAWFECRFQASEATQSDWLFGLVITDTDPMTSFTDGIAFTKNDGDALINLSVAKASSVVTTPALSTFVAATFTTLAFYYDGKDLFAYKDGVQIARLLSPVIPDTNNLRITFHHQNGDANARTMLIDRIFAAQER